jgi:hypothetical protein
VQLTARKKHPFKGTLSEPIMRTSVWTTALVADANRDSPAAQEAIHKFSLDWIDRKKAEKLLLLARRYGVEDFSHPRTWLLVCLRLAEECVPGFSVVDEMPRGRGRSKAGRFDLVKAIDILCATEGLTVSRACQQLVSNRKSRWYGRSAEALANDHRNWLHEIQELAAKPVDEFWHACEATADGARKQEDCEQ